MDNFKKIPGIGDNYESGKAKVWQVQGGMSGFGGVSEETGGTKEKDQDALMGGDGGGGGAVGGGKVKRLLPQWVKKTAGWTPTVEDSQRVTSSSGGIKQVAASLKRKRLSQMGSKTAMEALMNHAGIQPVNPLTVKLLSAATHMFIRDVIDDAMNNHSLKLGKDSQKPKSEPERKGGKNTEKKQVLTMEELEPVLKKRGINARKPPYHK